MGSTWLYTLCSDSDVGAQIKNTLHLHGECPRWVFLHGRVLIWKISFT